MSNVVKTITCIEFEEYDLYDQWTQSVEVPHRDPAQLDFKALLMNTCVPVDGVAAPRMFRFYDVDINADGDRVNERNYSKTYLVADSIRPFADYKAEETAKMEKMKLQKTTFLGRGISSFLDDGFSLTRACKAAFSKAQPMMYWYIQNTTNFIADAEAAGATHVAFLYPDSTRPEMVTKSTIVLNKRLEKIYPLKEEPNMNPTKEPAP